MKGYAGLPSFNAEAVDGGEAGPRTATGNDVFLGHWELRRPPAIGFLRIRVRRQ